MRRAFYVLGALLFAALVLMDWIIARLSTVRGFRWLNAADPEKEGDCPNCGARNVLFHHHYCGARP